MMYHPIEGNTSTTIQMGNEIQAPSDNFPLPLYYYSIPHVALKNNIAVKSDNSGITYDISTSRKRLREDQSNLLVNSTYNMPCNAQAQQHQEHAINYLSFLGEDFSSYVQSQQIIIECLISNHMEKVRYEMEKKRKTQSRKILEAIQVDTKKRLKAKEEEIQKIGKLNLALEERVKTVSMENQLWRDLAQSNEATANALRINLEQVLAQVSNIECTRKEDQAATIELDDAQSCCGSSGNNVARDGYKAVATNMRLCKNCFKDESCVLLLPCKHVCLCRNCGSSLHVCPVCKSFKTASVHVNMS